jgi:DNA-binding NarL/FixJ family response regulator
MGPINRPNAAHGVLNMTIAAPSVRFAGMARFLIVDDHPLFREALHSALEIAWPKAEAVEAVTVDGALELLGQDPAFDLILLDLNLPGINGLDGLVRIRGLFPRIPVVVISGHEARDVVAEVMRRGACGFIPKSSRKAELADAVRRIMEEGTYLPEAFREHQPQQMDAPRRLILDRLASLTPQQMRVLDMLRAGLLNKQIAHEMQVGETTVKAHVSEILRKLHVFSRTQAVIEVSKLDAAELLKAHDGVGS